MEVFREFTVNGTEDQIIALIEVATTRLPDGWIRADEAEAGKRRGILTPAPA